MFCTKNTELFENNIENIVHFQNCLHTMMIEKTLQMLWEVKMASSKLNTFSVGGYVADELFLHPKDKTEGSVMKVTFHLRNPKVVGGKQFYNEFYVVVYGKNARECIEHLTVGSECIVVGSANTWAKTDPETGVKNTGIAIDAKEVYFL